MEYVDDYGARKKQNHEYLLYYVDPETKDKEYHSDLMLSGDQKYIIRKPGNRLKGKFKKAKFTPEETLKSMTVDNVIYLRVTRHYHAAQPTRSKTTECFLAPKGGFFH